MIRKHEKIKTFFRHIKAFFLELYDVCSKLLSAYEKNYNPYTGKNQVVFLTYQGIFEKIISRKYKIIWRFIKIIRWLLGNLSNDSTYVARWTWQIFQDNIWGLIRWKLI